MTSESSEARDLVLKVYPSAFYGLAKAVWSAAMGVRLATAATEDEAWIKAAASLPTTTEPTTP